MKIVGLASAASLFLLIASAISGSPQTAETMTPLLLAVQDAPIPFTGSDGRTHLVYELGVTNFSSAPIVVEKVEVMGDGMILDTLDTAAVTERLQPAGQRESAGTLAGSAHANLFLHLVLALGAKIPSELSHRVGLRA